MAHTECCELARVSESLKVRRSPDWSLQLDSMKPAETRPKLLREAAVGNIGQWAQA